MEHDQADLLARSSGRSSGVLDDSGTEDILKAMCIDMCIDMSIDMCIHMCIACV